MSDPTDQTNKNKYKLRNGSSSSIKTEEPTTSFAKMEDLVSALINRFDLLEQNMDSVIGSHIKEAIVQINSKIDELNSKIMAIELRLNERISTEVAQINANFKSNLDTHNKRINNLETAIKSTQNNEVELRLSELERLSKGNDLIINGFPKNVLNLKTAFQNICDTISFDYTLSGNDSIFRLQSGVIIIKFHNFNLKDSFFNKYLKFKNLNLSHIGCGSNKRIYINESLSKHATDLLKTANRMRKDGWISNTFTKNGFVFIKKSTNAIPIKITNENQLLNRYTDSNASTHSQRPATPSRVMELMQSSTFSNIS